MASWTFHVFLSYLPLNSILLSSRGYLLVPHDISYMRMRRRRHSFFSLRYRIICKGVVEL